MIILDECLELLRNGCNIRQEDSGEYPITRIETISLARIDINRVRYCTPTQEQIEKYKLIEGDILFSHINSPSHVGKTAIYYDSLGTIIHGINLLLLRPNKNILLPKYLDYYLKSNKVRTYFETRCKKSVNQASLNQKDIKELKVVVPPLEEQERIVSILKRAESCIKKRKESNVLLDELVRSRFIEMFGDPSKNQKGWEISGIGKYLNVLTDYHSNGSYESLRDNVTLLDTPSYALMVRTTDLEKNNFEDDVKYIDEHAYNHLEKSKVFGGEIIINKIGSAGKAYLMPFLNRPVSLAMNQFLLRFDEDKVNHVFLYNLLLTPYMEVKIKEKVRGAVTKTITKDAIREIKIIVPPIEIQNQFVDFVKQVDKLKFEMETSLKELENNFNSLMQKAFNGEL